MSSSNLERIKSLTNELTFSDNSTVSSRLSKIIIRQNNLGFSMDVSGINMQEAIKMRQLVTAKITQYQMYDKISIVLTSTKKHQKSDYSRLHIDGVKKTIVIASGKGGVGKSTIAALLGHKLVQEGNKVGIVDADIYGPSIPHIFNLSGKPEVENNKMIPLTNYGISINSIGLLTKPEASISWRGPMTSKALYQLLSLTKWNNLDYLIIDTPPGTGDIHLSLLQNYLIDQVIMVVIPQIIAELDVSRAISLYRKFNISFLGVIENMHHYIDEYTGRKIKIFTGDSGKRIAKSYDMPLIAQVPIISSLSDACDKGKNLQSFAELLKFDV